MTVRYLFNTAGNYIAFQSGTNVFTPDGEWIGVVTHGNEFYDTQGYFQGYVLADDRIANNPTESSKPRILRPPRPSRPFLPLRPLRRLRMWPVPQPYRDLFADSDFSNHASDFGRGRPNFDHFIGASLYAPNGVFLGNINGNRFDPDSLRNQFGDYGSKYNSMSIFNSYGEYGSVYGANSPYNSYAEPLKIVKDGRVLGQISKNRFYEDSIDPDDFLQWLSTL